jgi:hypothetical protein
MVLSSRPAQSVSLLQPVALQTLFGKEQPLTAQERQTSKQEWRRLRSENAPFRIVTEAGLISTSLDYFDPLLLAQTTAAWQSISRIIVATISLNSERYLQVGDVMLRARVAALIDQGTLVADGDPWNLSSSIRLLDNMITSSSL